MCIFLRKRSRKYKVIFYCKAKKKEITLRECKKCSKRAFKVNKPIKTKTKKLAKAERNRKSILQADNKRCYVCGQATHLDKDEAFGGCNRQTSIKWRLVYYLCRKCHKRKDVDKELRQKLHDNAREVFINKYGEELFLKEFGKYYIEK